MALTYPTRRGMMRGGLAMAGLAVAGSATAGLVSTPRQTEGPFYPRLLPLDSDTDLVDMTGRPAPAAGTVTHVFGRVLSEDGRPMSGARVEIWQCDAFGRYHHAGDSQSGADPNFQGYGQTRVGADAGYRFRTIRPVPYSWRTPHIHFAVSGPGFRRLTTQMYVEGEPRNLRDSILNSVRDPAQKAALIVPLSASDLENGALEARFDIVLGRSLFS